MAFASLEGNKIVYRIQTALTVLALQGATADAATSAAVSNAAEPSALHGVAVFVLLFVRLMYWAAKQLEFAASVVSSAT